MTLQDRNDCLERAGIERELAKSAPDQFTAILHQELAARYDAIASIEVKPKFRLVTP